MSLGIINTSQDDQLDLNCGDGNAASSLRDNSYQMVQSQAAKHAQNNSKMPYNSHNLLNKSRDNESQNNTIKLVKDDIVIGGHQANPNVKITRQGNKKGNKGEQNVTDVPVQNTD